MSVLFERLDAIASGRLRRKPAVVDSGRSLSYADLLSASDAFFTQMREAGVLPGDRVGVVLGNCTAFLIAAFGVWKHGAVLLPLNPQLTETELLQYLLDGSARALVSSARNSSLLRGLQARGAPLEHAWLWRSDDNEWTHARMPSTAHRLDRGPILEGAALTQYSTGSTGLPRRITRTHSQLLGEFLSVSAALGMASDVSVVGVAPFFHSHGLMNAAVLTLLSGGTLHVQGSFFARDIARLIERERIGGLPAVPFMFQLLAALPERNDLSSLRFALSAGAPLPLDTAHAFHQAYGIAIRQLYGATETGVIAVRTDATSDWNSVGIPIGGVEVTIVDGNGQEVPAGTPGRVRIASRFAASRYDGGPSNGESHFTAEAFYPGDLGVLGAQGELVLRGRHRGFINVSGSKVDPGEVEAALLECPGVTEAVVFGVADGAAGEKVKAVVVAPDISYEQIRAHCMRRLAEFKHPRVIEWREQLPKSPLGKVLRKYLLEEHAEVPDRHVFSPSSGFVAASENAEALERSRGLSMLPPFLRVLLCTDGTVTRSLEAYFWEPIDVDVLSHGHATSEHDYPALGVAAGDSLVRRRVLLRGRITRSIYAFAESVMHRDGLSATLKRELIDERKGIGELLRDRRLETYRELGDIRRCEAKQWAAYLEVSADAHVMIRSYRIFHAGQATIQIEEVFPEARFQRA